MKHFFSCDWGTTSFRLRCVNTTTGTVLTEHCESTGARTLYSLSADTGAKRETLFAEFLRDQLKRMAAGAGASLDGASVMISGMASSSIGWRELPYTPAPVGLDGVNLVQESIRLNIDHNATVVVRLISGLRTDSNIMRGEETEILGLFAASRFAETAQQGIVVLPGTHSKHVQLRDGRIIDFHTFMSGELFDVLSTHSVLRASLQTDAGDPPTTLFDTASRDAFVAGVQAARDNGIARSLFLTRTRTVLHSVSPAVNRWFLSGLLIGAEIDDLSAHHLKSSLLLAAAEPLSAAYHLALETLGLGGWMTVVPPDEMSTASVRGHLMMLNAGDNETLRMPSAN